MKNRENIEHKEELQAIAADLGLTEGQDFQFICDLSNEDKTFLLQRSDVNLYTPVGEHFGIVPLEAMACGTPSVGMASGGPLETIIDNKTGLLVPEPFSEVEVAKKLELFLLDKNLASQLGKNGVDHVAKNFSFEAFANQLDEICTEANKPL